MGGGKHDPMFSGLETMDLPLVGGREGQVEQIMKGSAFVSVSKAPFNPVSSYTAF